MNVHHLELFYYVARFEGITEAVRNIPYGIQQPAISGQILQLEDYLGKKLFQRRPFRLTPEGQELFEFIKPFFANLDSLSIKLKGGPVHHIRLGASEIVLRDHVPHLIQSLRRQFPDCKLTLKEGYQPQIETWLVKEEIDLGLTLIGDRPQPGIQTEPLLQLPLALLVSRESSIRSAEDLWKQDRIDQTLINLPANEAITRNFEQGLEKRGIDWFPGMEVSSLHLIETYVANGFGIGLFVQTPMAKLQKEVRAIPLSGFPPVTFGMLWKGTPTPVVQAFMEEARNRSRTIPS